MSKVLVTGATGFLGAHCIAELLRQGYTVRGTLRAMKRAGEVEAMMVQAGVAPGGRLSLVEADLTTDEGWSQAVEDVDYVLHTASPFPAGDPDHEDDLIIPARDGALRVLRAAEAAGVRRVVLTSSFAAVGYGHEKAGAYDETDWTDPAGADVQPYMKSKTLAERAAWDFAQRPGAKLELAVVNPVGIFGPTLGKDLSTSIALVRQLLSGAMAAAPRLFFATVDVRDVVDLHLRAMVAPNAAGERFLAASGETVSLLQVADILRQGLGEAAAKAPTQELPDAVVRATPGMEGLVPQLGIVRRVNAQKAVRLLGWAPRSPQEALIATGKSLIAMGLVEA